MTKSFRRGALSAAIILTALLPSPASFARGHGGGHGRSRRSGTGRSSTPSRRSEHVNGYTTKKGRHVDSYNRAPKGSGDSKIHPDTPKREVKKGESAAKKAESSTKLSEKAASSDPAAKHNSDYAVGVARDKEGRIKRSEEASDQFEKQTGYPKGRPGYVIDHVVPLKRGGADSPANMQWQTVEQAKAKDKVE